MSQWQHGDTVIVRNIARSDGTVTTAIPMIVMRDDSEALALYLPAGTAFKNNWVIPPDQRVASVDGIVPSAQRQYRDLTWRTRSVRLYMPNRLYSVWLMFDDAGAFTSWYGNLEARYVRTALGIDTRDYALDVIAYPDGRWHRKDEDEFNRRLEVGIDSAEHQARVREAGHDFIARFERGTFPFDQGWQRWQPAENWQPRELPETWADDLGSHARLSIAKKAS